MKTCDVCGKPLDLDEAREIYSPFDNSKRYRYCGDCRTKYMMAFDLWLAACRKEGHAKPLADALTIGC